MQRAFIRQISDELAILLRTREQVVPFSQRFEGFDLAAAYDVVGCLKDLRGEDGERPVGRKVGFTNRHIWEKFGVSAPVWNYVFDATVQDAGSESASLAVGRLQEPLIEPELVLHLSAPPKPGMSEVDLLACIDWVAAGFEIVHSIFPDWKFSAADGAAAYGMHSGLVIGKRMQLPTDPMQALNALRDFSVTLQSDSGKCRQGHATDVLGGPLHVLRHLADEIARHPASEPLKAGEIVTTGTLTEAMSARPGDTWSVRFDGIALQPLELRLS